MNAERSTGFECDSCGVELPAAAVAYDDLGYPVCPECAARTGPLASVETDDSVGVAD